ncbi:MAG: peptidase S41 [Cyanobacteria bacterium SW_9_44_58]|nr:MAG: peptidase S41 [Cyanobacteria bacterium SW_9_44_58]
MVMTKGRLVLGATAAMLTTVAVTGAGVHLSQSQAFFRESPKELVDEVWQIVNQQYVDATFNQVDWQAVRQEYLNRSYEDKQEAYKAINEMLEELDDPYTRFMKPEEFKNLQIDTSGELTGVGIQIALDEETDYIRVISPIEETPAYEAGIIAKDLIIAINGKSTKGMELNEAVSLIRGKPGTEVTLTIKRGEEKIDYDITRARIEVHPVKTRLHETSQGQEMGYIRLNQFNANASEEMRNAINKFEKQDVEGYILDLRSNPGGLLQASVQIARMWLDEGKLVSTVNRQGETDVKRANGNALTDKPLAVLVDGGSASASEILAGALQDNNRAVIVGTQTFGKGLVQSVRRVGAESGLAVTVAKYLTPDGRDINKEGITPNIISEMSEEQQKALQRDRAKIGTLQDPQFSEALSVLKSKIAKQGKPAQARQQ